LNTSFTPEAYLDSSQRAKQRAAINLSQASLLTQLKGYMAADVVQFRSIRYMGLTADARTVELLKTSPDVRSIREDEFRSFSLVQSTEMIGAPVAWLSGYSGQGQMIAILDSGVDKNHPFLSGKVISEACFSANDTGRHITSVCPSGAVESTAPGSGLPCGPSEACQHGTKVAGIAAGRSLTNLQGVARDASLISIQISNKITDPMACGSAEPCFKTTDLNYMRALDYVLGLKNSGWNIAAVNMSFGEKTFSSICDSVYPDIAELINNLRAADVATVVAAGNNGQTQRITAPACISSAISVGSVGDGSFGGPNNLFAFRDVVTSDSNNAPFLSLLAPGEWIETSVPNGGFLTDHGTSLAAPHVAGAWAILKQLNPGARVQQILDALRSTGVQVADTRNGSNNIKPRIQIDQAMRAMQSCGFSLSAAGVLAPSTAGAGVFNVIAAA
jgi:subtilisin family serine protease